MAAMTCMGSPVMTRPSAAAIFRIRCTAAGGDTTSTEPERRSANYQPSSWDYDSLLGLSSGSSKINVVDGTSFAKLKGEVRSLVLEEAAPAARLRLIDTIQRLGVAYHFEEELDGLLNTIAGAKLDFAGDLLSPTLLFRLLRQKGLPVSPDHALASLRDGNGGFKAELRSDVEGALSLYEASHLAFAGEDVLDEARAFATKALKDIKPSLPAELRFKVGHALGLPIHWRAERLEAISVIDHYLAGVKSTAALLQFAKLDFNNVQSTYQEDLTTMAGWWRDIALTDRLSFARDRLMENFHFATGIIPQPKFTKARRAVTQIFCLIVHLDDVYDIYGTLDELTLFTDAIRRWDMNATKDLPEYMQAIYSVILNTSHEIAEEAKKVQGVDALPTFKKAWLDLCNAFLTEAKWHYKSIMPPLRDYLDNGWMSSSGALMLTHAFPLLDFKVAAGDLQQFGGSYPPLVKAASKIFRLCNDSATHSAELERGDAPSSIALHMRENKSSEEDSRAAMAAVTMDTWKEINGEAFRSRELPGDFIAACINLARISHCIYQGGDGIGAPDEEKKNQIRTLYLQPMPVDEAAAQVAK